MPSLHTLIGSLRATIDHIAHLIPGTARSASQAAEARDRAAALGAERSAGQLAGATSSLEEAQVLAAALADRIRVALAAAETARTGTGGGGRGGAPPGPPPTPAPPPEPPWSRHPPVPGFRPDRPHPTCMDETRRVGWPVNRNGRVSARGRLYDAYGRPITGTVQAGTGPADHARDLQEPWASDERMTTRWHIEGHAAAIMRQHRLRESVLYINIPPCGSENQSEWRCDANIAKLIPKGSTLRVWVARQNGRTARFVYHGTGEALK